MASGLNTITRGIPDPSGATQRAIRALDEAINQRDLRIDELEETIDGLSVGGGAVSSVTAGSSMVTCSPTTGAVVVNVIPANFTGIPQAAVTGLVAGLAGKAAAVHTHAQADVMNLVADLAAKVSATRNINTTAPLAGGGDLSADRTLTVADNSTASKGVVAIAPNDTTKFWRGDATWATAVLGSAVLGCGYDGALVFDGVNPVVVNGTTFTPTGGVYTLTRPLHATSITMSGGASIDCGGWPIFCQGTISGGTIERDGNNAIGNGQGGSLAAGMLPGANGGGQGSTGGISAAGGNSTAAPWPFVAGAAASKAGGTGNGNNGARGQGGSGGAGSNGASGAGGTVTLPAAQYEALVPDRFLSGRTYANTFFTSGSGGGGGGAGSVGGNAGGGGGGGGWVVVTAREFIGVTLSARGGNGGNASGGANTGGGGGGAGGFIVAIYATGSAPTMDVAGGVGGAPLGTGGTGGTGGDGFAIAIPIA